MNVYHGYQYFNLTIYLSTKIKGSEINEIKLSKNFASFRRSREGYNRLNRGIIMSFVSDFFSRSKRFLHSIPNNYKCHVMWHRYSYCGHFRDSDGKTIVDVTRQKQVPPHSKALVLSSHSSTSVLLTVAVLPTVPLPCHNALNPSGRPLRVNRTMILRTHQNTFLSLHSCSWCFPCFEIWRCIA
jgi:hypothetical protein